MRQTMSESDKEKRRLVFKSKRAELGLSQGQLAVWIYGKNTKTTRNYIGRKESGTDPGNPVTDSELCFLAALGVLKERNVNLKSLEMSTDLEILKLLDN
jgi:hypothetical protein